MQSEMTEKVTVSDTPVLWCFSVDERNVKKLIKTYNYREDFDT